MYPNFQTIQPMKNFLAAIFNIRRPIPASIFLKSFLIGCLLLITSSSFATNIPPHTSYWGCKIGNKIYWEYLNTNSTSGGVTYYDFNGSGEYTQWDDDYALRSGYQCYRYIKGPSDAGCKVNGQIGTRGFFDDSSTNCPMDNDAMLLGMGLILCLTYRYRPRNPK
jgi:hypothetical protein